MSRGSTRAWVASAAALGVAVAVACSTTASNPGAPADGGLPSPESEAAAEGGAGITLDALPTALPDTAPVVGDDAALPDAAGPPCARPSPSDPCGLDPQCGCASTQTCELDVDASTACVTAGTAPAGHACTLTAGCAPGLTCFNGACRPYCSSSGDAGCAKIDGGGECLALRGADGGPVPNDDVCTFHCMLQDPNACGQTGDIYAGCVPDGLGGTDCALVGIAPLGGSCAVSNCKPALVCVSLGGASGTCMPWCRVGQSPSDCGDGEACQAFSTNPPTAYGVQYGFCP